jgi:hypothetical protein
VWGPDVNNRATSVKAIDVMTVSRWERGIRKEIPAYLHLALDALEYKAKEVKKGKGTKKKKTKKERD